MSESISDPVPTVLPSDPAPPPPPSSEPSPSEPTPSPPISSDPPPTSPSESVSEPSVSDPTQPTNSQPSEPTPSAEPSANTTPPPNSPSNSPSQVVVTDSNGGVVTVTTYVPHSPAIPSASQSGASGGSTSFFDNKGAVAGTFAVVGLIALGLIFVLVTWGIRRRRAKQFDRDVAEAAHEAAHASPPTFLDDPADDGDHSYATQKYVYSDNSHGTFAQPPMDHYPADTYNMNQINHNYPGAGAAGVGVMRARSRKEFDDTASAASAGMAGYGAGGGLHGGLGETQSPYPVFAAPAHHTPDMYENRYPAMHDHGNEPLAVDTSVAAATAAPAVNRNPSQTLARQKSQGTKSLIDGYYGSGAASMAESQPESYASRYQPGYKPDPNQFPVPALPADAAHSSANGARTSVYRDDDDAYGGYSSPGHNNSPGDPTNRNSVLDTSDDDSDDRHDNRRVLKVANE